MDFVDNQIPPEVVSVIMSKLGQNDLLNTRRVCKRWNTEACLVLRHSNFTVRLTVNQDRQVNELSGFLEDFAYQKRRKNKVPQPFLLPFHLDLHLEPFNPSYTPSCFMGQLMNDVRSLFEVYGPNCVTKLTLRSRPSMEFRNLFKMLALMSGGLKVLDLSRLEVSAASANESVVINYLRVAGMPAIDELQFPNLKILKCNAIWLIGLHTLPIYSIITDKSPALEVLKLKKEHIWRFASYANIPFGTLKTFRAGLVGGELNMLNQIRRFPSLIQTLSLEYYTRDVGTGLSEILEVLSPTLKNLKIKYLCLGKPSPKLARFPNLPYLRTLQLRFGSHQIPLLLNCESINFTREALPALQSLDIPSGCHFVTDANSNPDSKPPNITNLAIYVEDWSRTSFWPPKSISRAHLASAENLLATFPNIEKVVLKQHPVPGPGDNTNMLKFLTKFLCSDVTVSNIATLEVELYSEDVTNDVLGGQYFSEKLSRTKVSHKNKSKVGEIAAAAEAEYHRLTNLKCLRLKVCGVNKSSELPPWKCQTRRRRTKKTTYNNGMIAEILSNFPNISQLDLSEEFLSKKSRRSAFRRLEEIRETLPNMTINFL